MIHAALLLLMLEARTSVTSFHHQPEAQHPKSSAIHNIAGRLPHLLADFVAKVGDGKGGVIFSMSGSHLLRALLLAAGPLKQRHCRPRRLRSTSRGHRGGSDDQFGEPA